MFQLFSVPCFPRMCLWSEIQLPGTGWNSSLPGKPTETQAPGSAAWRSVHPLCFRGHWAWKQLVGLKWIPESSKPTEKKKKPDPSSRWFSLQFSFIFSTRQEGLHYQLVRWPDFSTWENACSAVWLSPKGSVTSFVPEFQGKLYGGEFFFSF